MGEEASRTSVATHLLFQSTSAAGSNLNSGFRSLFDFKDLIYEGAFEEDNPNQIYSGFMFKRSKCSKVSREFSRKVVSVRKNKRDKLKDILKHKQIKSFHSDEPIKKDTC